MPTTFTIKQVPDALADSLRRRAADNRRSLQKELQAIMEDAVDVMEIPVIESTRRVSEPPAPADLPPSSHKNARLSLDQAWQRARKLAASPSASAAIARDNELLEKAGTAIGSGERGAVLREGLKALIEREAARRLIRLGGSAPGARRPPRRRSAAISKKRRGGA